MTRSWQHSWGWARITPTSHSSCVRPAATCGRQHHGAIDPHLQISDRSLRFQFDDLPLGGYVAIAGTDMNNDGNLCDPGEVCGMYPVRSLPTPIEFTGVKERVNFDLQVTGTETR